MTQRIPAEWEPQDAILLAWPHGKTQWHQHLDDVIQLYEALISVICDYADVVVAIPEAEIDSVQMRLSAMEIPLEYVYFYPVNTNETWIRDFGPISVQTSQGIKLLDFSFNGCGNKHKHDFDDAASKLLYSQNAFPAAEIESINVVLEAGSIETDGNRTLLASASCLLNKNRNPHLSQTQIEQQLKDTLGVSQIHWLTSGYLVGDNTDGHVDLLARFCPNNTIVYTACDDEQDEHYASLKAMENELRNMTNIDGHPYRMLALPWPGSKFGDADQRLPATYTQFLIVNEAVLVPIYDSLSDEDALEIISQAFPGYEIFGFPCLSLLEHGRSLHSITMQLSEGVLMQA